MNKLLLILCLSYPFTVFAQADYFQQEVNYTIEVTLDDELHQLKGDISIEYINRSPDDLSIIHFHLWPNAYKNRKTAYAKQELRTGSSRFYFADKSTFGKIIDLNFSVEGQSVSFEADKKHPDMGILTLGKPLKSGERIVIQTPFTVKIPESFSRLGHVDQSYQMTQWYPKPAVYDKDGWHPMPYLDMGEFYSEFGNFDVSITLPENYLVGATGVLQTESEIQFLQEQIERSTRQLADLNMEDSTRLIQNAFPVSSTQSKTIRYKAEKVHDFAWFADKRFYVQKSEVTLSDKRIIDTWAFFTNEEANIWKRGAEYLNRSIKYYSDEVGHYPYPQATAVQSALSAGGGMEYPMITVIGLSGMAQDLDEVITHEVGHNWFYGILASNERSHPWMDEGLNTFYEKRYMNKYYETTSNIFLPDFFLNDSDVSESQLAYLFQATRNKDQAPETHSKEFSRINYWLGAYEKPARNLKMLEHYIGKENFDRAMHAYYDTWKFKHPQPSDFRKILEAESGKDLTWLFDGLTYSNKKMDYAIKSISEGESYQLKIKNKGKLKAPFPISGMKDGKVVTTKWYEGFEKEQKITFPNGDYDLMVLDAEAVTLDVDRRNNNIKTSGGLKKIEPFRFKFLTGVENPKRTTLYWAPLLGWNNYDKTMLGLGLYNITVPERPLEFSLAPMFSFNTKDVVGLANVDYHFYPSSNLIQQITLGGSYKRFNFLYNKPEDVHYQYRRFVPSITVQLKTPANSKLERQIKFRTIVLHQDDGSTMIDSAGERTFTPFTDKSIMHELSFLVKNRRVLNPYSLKIALEKHDYDGPRERENYLKLSMEWKSSYTYASNRSVDFRIFGGYFLSNSRRNLELIGDSFSRGRFSMTQQGLYDYNYDELYFDRQASTGILSQQITLEDGGFKNAIGNFAAGQGQANNFLIALNIKGDLPQDLPFSLPLKPYFDLGYFDDSIFNRGTTITGEPRGASDRIWYSGGLMLDFFDGMFGVYFPIVNSSKLKELYKQRGDFWTRVTFNLDLNRASPFRLRNRIDF